jgi:hypothetical protein
MEPRCPLLTLNVISQQAFGATQHGQCAARAARWPGGIVTIATWIFTLALPPQFPRAIRVAHFSEPFELKQCHPRFG